jgi:hypothetical protein
MTKTRCSILAVEDTSIEGSNVTVTAVVEDMRLLYRATYHDPEEWAPALCTASFQLDEGEQVPTDEDGFCSYLDSLDLEWQLLDTSDWSLD